MMSTLLRATKSDGGVLPLIHKSVTAGKEAREYTNMSNYDIVFCLRGGLTHLVIRFALL
jgi:hypothetical protein